MASEVAKSKIFWSFSLAKKNANRYISLYLEGSSRSFLSVGRCAFILGMESIASKKLPVMNTWIENATHLTFPRFHFKTQGNEYIQGIDCLRNNVVIPTGVCNLTELGESPPGLSNCIAVHADTITVENKRKSPLGDVEVYCMVKTVGSSNNSLLEWGLEGMNVGPFGPNAFSGVYILPTQNAWVLLEQRTIHPSKHLPRQTQWSRSLVYHTSESQSGYYGVTTIIGTFYVEHMEPADVYDGWRSFSDIGGFMFFLCVIHTILMLAVGIIFENNSKFLNKTSDENELSEKTALIPDQQQQQQ